MTEPDPAGVTRLLQAMQAGDPSASDALAPLVYRQLHDMAGRALRGERSGHTLQPTALVHEAFVRLTGQRDARWADRGHFYSLAARIMRRILVDHARKRLTAKRGSGGLRVTLTDSLAGDGAGVEDRTLEVIAIEEALSRLEAVEERPARVVELRFFAGLDLDETAQSLGISVATVKRDWVFARAFLRNALAGEGAGA
jgi:RNA polymerase sigma factor (TIGR02999 family)